MVVAGAMALSLDTASAYTVGSGSTASAPSAVAGGQPFVLSVVFKQPDGSAFPAGVAVTFSQGSGPSAALPARTDGIVLMADVRSMVPMAVCLASFNPVTTNTDANGAASATVTLPAGCPGQYVLSATAAGGGTVSTTVAVTGAAAGAFPNTSAQAAAARQPIPWLPIGGAAIVLVALSGLLLGSRLRHRE